MGRISTTICNGIRGYWRRKGYERLNRSHRKRKARAVALGSISAEGSTRRRRFGRIKLTPRLNLKLRFSPKKFLLGLRDAYVNMMLKIANTRLVGSIYGGNGVSGYGMRTIKEYDERMIMEIYKSIVMAQGQLLPRDASWIGSEIGCTR